MASSNDELLDALIRHQIGLMRFSGSIRNRVIELLNETEGSLRQELEARLARAATAQTISPVMTRRLQFLEQTIKNIRYSAIDKAFNIWNDSMKELVVAEAEFVNRSLRTVSPVLLDLATPATSSLLSLVAKQPLEGKTLKQWANNLKQADVSRIMGAVKVGIVRGDPVPTITKRVLGTARNRGTDGILELTRQQAEAITRTAVNHFSNKAKEATYAANSDIISEEVFVATLDSRTTPVCRALDGKRYPVGQGPRPPLHFNCRSVRVAVIDGKVIGERPVKPTTERMLVKEYSAKQGLTARSRDALPRGHKGSFDEFARRRTRELTGQVPASTTYQQFLSRQPASFQDDVLGKTKGALFRRGGLTLDRFVDRQGNELTLKDLVRRDRNAFIKAGLNPDAF